MSNDFKWQSEENEDCVVFKTVYAVACHFNRDGDVVIRQENWAGEDDNTIVIPVDRIPSLIEALQRLHDTTEADDA